MLTYWIELCSSQMQKVHKKYFSIHEVQAPKEEDLDRQTVISTDSTMKIFVSRLC